MDLFLVQKKACDAVAAFRSKPHRFIVMRLVVGLRSYLFWGRMVINLCLCIYIAQAEDEEFSVVDAV